MVIGPALTAAAQIGDGAVVYQVGDASIHALTGPASVSEYINEAIFLISSGAIARADDAVIDERPRYLAMFERRRRSERKGLDHGWLIGDADIVMNAVERTPEGDTCNRDRGR